MSGSHFSITSFSKSKNTQNIKSDPISQKPKFNQGSIYNNVNKVSRVRSGKFSTQSAFDRHKQLVNNYLSYYGKDKSVFKRDKTKFKRDIDIVKENHRFLWEDDEGTVLRFLYFYIL